MKFPKPGEVGIVHGDKEPGVTARAKVVWANARQMKVELLEDFYCCEAGEQIRCATRLWSKK